MSLFFCGRLFGSTSVKRASSDTTKLPSRCLADLVSLWFAVLFQMKDLHHENVNLFLGFFSDCGIFAIVTEYCSRGSLEDLLRNEDMKLDWMFKSSLVMDLIKVNSLLLLRHDLNGTFVMTKMFQSEHWVFYNNTGKTNLHVIVSVFKGDLSYLICCPLREAPFGAVELQPHSRTRG